MRADPGEPGARILGVIPAKLLGAEVILAGIGPSVATSLIQLGVNLGDVLTLSTLQSGIAHALGR